jgi:hypothetical protein
MSLAFLTLLSRRWDALRQTCWYNSTEKFRWLIGTQTSWIMLFAVGEIAAFLIILGYLIAHEVSL